MIKGNPRYQTSAQAGGVAAVYLPRPSRTPAVVRHSDAGTIRSVLASRLCAHEWRRRAIHMCPGLLPALLFAIPHPDPLAWYSQVIIAAIIAGMAAFAIRKDHLFKRRDETGWTTSVVSYALITLTMLLGFPGQPEMGLAVTTIIAFGDGGATLGGLLLRGPRLPWNVNKSWAGLASFLIISVPLSIAVYWGEARPGVPWSVALLCVGPAALAAAVAESLPMRLNDNIRVGVTAALTILVTQSIFVESLLVRRPA